MLGKLCEQDATPALRFHTFQGLGRSRKKLETILRVEQRWWIQSLALNESWMSAGRDRTQTPSGTMLALNKAAEKPSGDCCAEHVSTSEVNCWRPICHPVPPFSAVGAFSGLWIQAQVRPWRLPLCQWGTSFSWPMGRERKYFSSCWIRVSLFELPPEQAS